jgi:hypothetical protein
VGADLVLQVISPAVAPFLIDSVHVHQFIASTALPNLRRFLMETDKIAAACTNIVYYIINPSMKGKSRYACRLALLHCGSSASDRWISRIASLTFFESCPRSPQH